MILTVVKSETSHRGGVCPVERKLAARRSFVSSGVS